MVDREGDGNPPCNRMPPSIAGAEGASDRPPAPNPTQPVPASRTRYTSIASPLLYFELFEMFDKTFILQILGKGFCNKIQ